MEDYFCPKINKELRVSQESYELCSDCRHSGSAKLRSVRPSKTGTKIEIRGESLMCHYNSRDFEIPIPGQSMSQNIEGGLARILAEDGAFGIRI